MKNLLFLFAAFAMMFVACDTSAPSIAENANLQTVKIGIEGMMCSSGCVGKVKKELNKVVGVADTVVEFSEEELIDFAFVEYDANITSKEDLVECISKIADGLYTVRSSEIISESESETESNSGENGLSVKIKNDFKLPGIVEIIGKFLPS